jgi:Protein kinase domain
MVLLPTTFTLHHHAPREMIFIPGDNAGCSPLNSDKLYVSNDVNDGYFIFRSMIEKLDDGSKHEYTCVYHVSPLARRFRKMDQYTIPKIQFPSKIKYYPIWANPPFKYHAIEFFHEDGSLQKRYEITKLRRVKIPVCNFVIKKLKLGEGGFGRVFYNPETDKVEKTFFDSKVARKTDLGNIFNETISANVKKEEENHKYKYLFDLAKNDTELMHFLTNHTPFRLPKKSDAIGVDTLLCDGMTMSTWLEKMINKQGSRIAILSIRTAMYEIFSVGVELIHVLSAHGLYHCDLKPDNLMICRGKLNVIDFGGLFPVERNGTVLRSHFTNKYNKDNIKACNQMDDSLQRIGFGKDFVVNQVRQAYSVANRDAFSLAVILCLFGSYCDIRVKDNTFLPFAILSLVFGYPNETDQVLELTELSRVLNNRFMVNDDIEFFLLKHKSGRVRDINDTWARYIHIDVIHVDKDDTNRLSPCPTVSYTLENRDHATIFRNILISWLDIVDTLARVCNESYMLKDTFINPCAVIVDKKTLEVRIDLHCLKMIELKIPEYMKEIPLLLSSLLLTLYSIHGISAASYIDALDKCLVDVKGIAADRGENQLQAYLDVIRYLMQAQGGHTQGGALHTDKKHADKKRSTPNKRSHSKNAKAVPKAPGLKCQDKRKAVKKAVKNKCSPKRSPSASRSCGNATRATRRRVASARA